jgi:peptidoglycan/LPS O-acetylase OafA/YrhL
MLNALILVCIIMSFIAWSYFYRGRGHRVIGNQLFSRDQTQSLSGIAISLILISHVGNFSGVRYFTPFGSIGVALFLMLSGYGLSESYKRNGLEKYLWKRIRRVLFPYWIIIIVYSVCDFRFNAYFNIGKPFKYAVFMDIPNVMYWFLYLIMFWYLSFFVINQCIKEPQHKIFSLFVISLALLFISRSQLYAEQAFSFLIGVIISYKKDVIERLLHPRLAYSVLGCSFFLSGMFLTVKQLHTVRQYLNQLPLYLIIQIPIIIFAALAIILFVTILDPVSNLRAMNHIGDYSYEIYLSHVFIIPIVSPAAYLRTIIVFILLTAVLALSLKKISRLVYAKKIF